jgi:hypothetical protein
MTMDDYFPGFMQVMYGDKDPAQVIEEIESRTGGYDASLDDEEFGEDDDRPGYDTGRDLGTE